MKYLAILLLSLGLLFGCVETKAIVVDAPETTVGYFNYRPAVQKYMADNELKEMDESTLLGLLTQFKRHFESQGYVIIGIESEKGIIWMEQPVGLNGDGAAD